MNDDIKLLLDRIAAGTQTDADLTALRRALLVGGQGNVIQIGKYNIRIGEGQDIRIGDTIYQGPTAEAIQAIIRDVLHAGPPGPSKTELKQAEARYRERVVATYNRLRFSGLPEADLMLTEVPLDKVFVQLSLTVEKGVRVREGKPGAGSEESRESAEMASSDRWTPDGERSTRDVEVPIERNRKDLHEDKRIVRVQEPVTLATALSKNVLVVGEPGAGKSTLLRWLAVTYARDRQREAEGLGPEADSDRLPIYVELGRLPDTYLRGEGGKTPNWKKLLPELIAEHQAFEPAAGPAVSRALADGRCLVLCDGLDEVADRAARARIAQSLAEFGRLSAGNRVAIGSRPAGIADTESALQPGFQRCQIERFTPDEVQRFFRFWYGLDASLTPDQQAAEANALHSRVQANPGIAKLAATPLLATILLLIWRNEGDLPARRVEVYERCCKILVENWERHHEVEYNGVLAMLGWEAHLRLLAPVAYAIHSREQRTSTTRDELVPVLARSLLQEGLCSSQQNARQEANGFLVGLGLRSGLLQRLGPEQYGFPHLTFQEYLAARHIGEQLYPDYIDLFMAHLHEAWWREVHLLTIGHLGSDRARGQKASRLILEILDRYPPPSRYSVPLSWYSLVRHVEPRRWLPGLAWQRHLAWLLGRELELAASGCGEMLPATITEEAADRLDRLAGYFVRESLFDAACLEMMSDLAPALGRVSPEVVAALISTSHLLPIAASSLGRLGQASPEAVAALIRALGDNGFGIRWAAASSLGQLGHASPEVMTALIDALRDYDSAVWWAVVSSLVQLGQASPEAVPVLIRALRDGNFYVQWAAAASLAQLGQVSSEAVVALIDALADSDSDVREAVAFGLSQFDSASPETVAALIGALNDSNYHVREAAASCLGHLGQDNPEAVAALISALAESDSDVRQAAVSGLPWLGPAVPEAMAALIGALNDSDYHVRETAASSLGKLGLLGSTSSEAVAALIRALQDGDTHVRWAAAESLGWLGQVPPEVVAWLIRALADSHHHVRAAAASNLGRLDPASPEAVAALICALADSDSNVREVAASSLGQLGQASTEVVAGLIRALRDSRSWVRQAAASGLGQLEQPSPKVVVTLIGTLEDSDSAVRWAAASSLGQLQQASPEAVAALTRALGDSDSDVRRAAASSLGQLGPASSEAVIALIGTLGDKDGRMRDAAAESLGLIQKLDQSQLQHVLRFLDRRVHDADRISRSTAIQAARRLLAGRPMPGQPWVPIREREKRQRRRLQVAIVVGVVAAILLVAALSTFAQEWFGAYSQIVSFVVAVAGMVALLAAVTEVLGYLRAKGKQ